MTEPIKYNYKKTIEPLSITENYDVIGLVSGDVPFDVDPEKEYEIKEEITHSSNLDGTFNVSKRQVWSEVEDVFEGDGSEPDDRSTIISTEISWSLEMLDLELFSPAKDYLEEASQTTCDFLSGKIIKAKNGTGWEYPAGVYGILPQSVAVEQKLAEYRNYRDAGNKARTMIPTATVKITVHDYYNEASGVWNGVPASINNIVTNPTLYKPDDPEGCTVKFKNTIPINFQYVFNGGSLSNTITKKNSYRAGIRKQKVEYNITKTWRAEFSADTTYIF